MMSDGYHSETRQEKHAAYIRFSIQMRKERLAALIFLFRAWIKLDMVHRYSLCYVTHRFSGDIVRSDIQFTFSYGSHKIEIWIMQ